MKGSAEEIASLEIAQTYAFEPPQTLTPLPPELERKTGPYEGILRHHPARVFHVDGRLFYNPYANQVTNASVTAGTNWKSSYANFSWFASRPVVDDAGPVLQLGPVPVRRRDSISAGISGSTLR